MELVSSESNTGSVPNRARLILTFRRNPYKQLTPRMAWLSEIACLNPSAQRYEDSGRQLGRGIANPTIAGLRSG